MIRTKRENDCGVCAVANALGCQWHVAADRVFGYRFDNKLKFNSKTRQIANALSIHDHKLIRVSLRNEFGALVSY